MVVAADACAAGQPAMSESVNGLVVWVEIKSIDGVGGTLGSAAACYRRVPSLVALAGHVRLDLDDLVNDLEDGTALATISHQLLHILGFGSLWNQLGLVRGSSNDPMFNGKHATRAFQDALSRPYGGFGVPVENLGGAGAAMSHWRTSLMGQEMMSAFACGGVAPLSYVTLSAFSDMGLRVTDYGDDDFEVPLSGCPTERRRAGVFEGTRTASERFIDERTGTIVSAADASARSRAVVRSQPTARPSKPVVVESARRNP
jgi:hypothetical protein